MSDSELCLYFMLGNICVSDSRLVLCELLDLLIVD